VLHKETIGFEEADKTVQAIIRYQNEINGLPVCICVVDDRGDLVQFVRMDGTVPMAAHMARRKAYTAAMLRRDTLEVAERLKQPGTVPDSYGDNMIVNLPGGVCIGLKVGGGVFRSVLGAIGVSGLPTGQEDDELAHIGLKALTE
jgi:uncharacterized protein GlcG (DUF336 family)